MINSLRLLQKKLLLKNLPANLTEAEFKETFGNPTNFEIPKFSNGNFRRFAFLTVADDTAASFLNKEFKIRDCTIQIIEASEKSPEKTPTSHVYISGFPAEFKKTDLEALFPTLQIKRSVIKKNRAGKEFAMVEFASLDDAIAARKLDRTKFKNNELMVIYAKEQGIESVFQ